ncbi:DUF2130 domain-containing protein [Candidatus Gottesmanbacteria bacterium]|nr:DUF2130 domain-containing protein [Candidatus Gottesmanbacteria bacterium]
MTSTRSITCPHCSQEISLDDALTHQIEEKIRIEKDKELQQEKVRMWKIAQEKAAEKVKLETDTELKLLKEALEEKDKKLDAAQRQELELRRAKNQLEEEKKSFELEKQRQLDAEREKIRAATAQELMEEHRLKDAERDKKLQDALRTNEELRRKLEQGSQQTQGEVLELALEELLKTEFPFDEITPVAKGIQGADVSQTVRDNTGKTCGTIIWESKRTKAWSDSWIQKLKDNQREAKAEIAVIISEVLPKDIASFGPKDGIYICDFKSFLGLAKILRLYLIQFTLSKLANVGKKEKMEVLWNYLTGTEFRQRVEAIVETFTQMKEDLEREKRAYTKMWAVREKQISRVMDNTIGMHGDLQGLIGASLPEIKQIELTPSVQYTEHLVEE